MLASPADSLLPTQSGASQKDFWKLLVFNSMQNNSVHIHLLIKLDDEMRYLDNIGWRKRNLPQFFLVVGRVIISNNPLINHEPALVKKKKNKKKKKR